MRRASRWTALGTTVGVVVVGWLSVSGPERSTPAPSPTSTSSARGRHISPAYDLPLPPLTARNPLADPSIGIADGCQFNTFIVSRLPDDSPDPRTLPRWVYVIDTKQIGEPGCIPRELAFPQTDNGVALAAYLQREGLGPLSAPLPIFGLSGALIGYTVPGEPLSVDAATARGLIPDGLIRRPPRISDFADSGVVTMTTVHMPASSASPP